jgi:hypothetical protein
MTSNMIRRCLPVTLLIAIAVATRGSGAEKADSAVKKADPTPTAEEIVGWISQLDDSRYLTREQATQRLLDAGGAALDSLLAAANGERPEPADRAVWIMRRLARSRDNEQSIAALERMVQLRGRPMLVEMAEVELDERSIAACQARLTQLGAEIAMEATPLDGVTIVPLLRVRLGEKWRGTSADLRAIAQLRRQLYFRFEGKAVDNEVAKLFEDKERLAVLQFKNSKVTPAAVDALKARHPDAIVYVRGQALLGVTAANNPAGAMVIGVERDTAAHNAGIVAGDVIASMDGQTLPDFDRLTAHIAQHEPGETVEVEIVRGDERKKLSVTLGSWAGRE